MNGDKMTAKQSLFVAEYMIDLSATKAALRAGYSPRTAAKIGSELLAKPRIKAALEQAMAERVKRTEITADDILRELGRVVFFDKRKLFDEKGFIREIRTLDDDTAAGLAEINVYEEYSGYGENRKSIGQTRKFKAFDKVAALSLYMRHLGMLKDRVEHTGRNGEPLIPRKKTDLTDDELLAIAAAAPRSRS